MYRSPVEIVACRPAEWTEALEVLYRRVPADLRAQMVAATCTEANLGQLDLSGLWLARRRGRAVGAMLTQRLAGRAAAVWPPETLLTWGRAVVAGELIRTALADLRRRGVRIAQALVDENTPRHMARDLGRAGMPAVTDLIYFRRETSRPLEVPPGVPRLYWTGFGPENEGEFRAVLEATYIDSLDMPELESARTLDDVLAGHRAAGRFDPARWRLGRVPGEPGAAALVLLSDSPEKDCWEVAYLGLTPSARRRGLGRAALAHGLDLARPHTEHLELAVDVRNRPALTLYRRTGFEPYDRRTVHLKVLGA